MKKYSLSYWIKQKLRFVSKPEEAICAAFKLHFESPQNSDIAFDGEPIVMINEMYIEWRKQMRGAHGFLFPTPLPVARELADFAGVTSKDVVFDPGCGMGNLLYAATGRGAKAFGVEFQYWLPEFVAPVVGLDIQRGDYLDGYQPKPFSCIIANPPFGRGYFGDRDVPDLTQAFLDRIADQSTPETKIGIILPRGYVNKERPKPLADTLARFDIVERQELPADTFKPLTNIVTEFVRLELREGKPTPRGVTVAAVCDRRPQRHQSPKVLCRSIAKNLRKAADQFESIQEMLL